MSIYSPEIQKLIIDFLLSDSEAFSRCRNILSDQFFDSEYRSSVRYLLEYADKYHAVPSFREINAHYDINYKKIDNITIQSSNALLDEVEAFCRHKSLENEILRAPDLLLRGQYNELEDNIKKSVLISLQKDLGITHSISPKTRLLEMRDKEPVVSLGWKSLDSPLYGGVPRGGLVIFAGGTGSGKSIFLQNLAINWAMQHQNVVYITCELSEDLVCMRLDSMISGIGYRDLFRNLDNLELLIGREYKQMGKIQVKYMPAYSNTKDIAAYLKEYEIQAGVKPTALIVDYLDILGPNNSKINPSDMFLKDKCVSEELRSYASEEKLLLCTASQLNRSSVDEPEHTHAHIAGGISKLNTADVVMSIHTSDSRRLNGEYQIQFLKTRSSAGVGKRVDLSFNVNTLRIIDKDGSGDMTNVSSIENNIKKSDIEDNNTSVYDSAPVKKITDKTEMQKLLNHIMKRNEVIRGG